jgi:hypothetical protein
MSLFRAKALGLPSSCTPALKHGVIQSSFKHAFGNVRQNHSKNKIQYRFKQAVSM